MLQNFDRHDQIVPFGEGLGDRALAAERLDRPMHLLDGKGRDVDAIRVDPSVAKRFDKQSEGAPRIEHTVRPDLRRDSFGDTTKKSEPFSVAFVGAAARACVIAAVKDMGRNLHWRAGILLRGPRLCHKPNGTMHTQGRHSIAWTAARNSVISATTIGTPAAGLVL
jgi:hypothetical protein